MIIGETNENMGGAAIQEAARVMAAILMHNSSRGFREQLVDHLNLLQDLGTEKSIAKEIEQGIRHFSPK